MTSRAGSAPSISSMLASCFDTTGKSIPSQVSSATGRFFQSTPNRRVWTMTIGVRLSESWGLVIRTRANTGLAARSTFCGIRGTSTTRSAPSPATSNGAISQPVSYTSCRFIMPLCTWAREPTSVLTLSAAVGGLDRRAHVITTLPRCITHLWSGGCQFAGVVRPQEPRARWAETEVCVFGSELWVSYCQASKYGSPHGITFEREELAVYD